MTTRAIFLSASVPVHGRGSYYENADPFLIQFAVRELLTTALGRRLIVWGGHPAITPMVWAACEDLHVQYDDAVTLYQSTFFRDQFPEENSRFNNVHYIDHVEGDRDASLLKMRHAMLSRDDLSMAVFIGGMEGVKAEYELFTKYHPDALILPIAAPGGAARDLAVNLGLTVQDLENINFSRTFHDALGVSPIEPRTKVKRHHVRHRDANADTSAGIGLFSAPADKPLTSAHPKIVRERVEFDEPVLQVALKPKTESDLEKMRIALSRLAQEDPLFRVRTDKSSGHTIIAGVSELHLEVIVDRMKREFGVEAIVGDPDVAYCETVRKSTEQEGAVATQSGDSTQYGYVQLRLEPNETGMGYEFVVATKGNTFPSKSADAVNRGIKEALPVGVLAGFPVVDAKVTLFDAFNPPIEMDEDAFKTAGFTAFKEAMRKAHPVLLEPMMEVEVIAPNDFTGTITGDLASRRGTVQGLDDLPGGIKLVRAEVPMAEMVGYFTQLRSLTHGRANCSMHFKCYSEAPKDIARTHFKNTKTKQ